MGFDVKNKKCAVCDAYLFEEDDVVCCPVCGAPHHRDCYISIGRCGFEQFHGTDLQYSDDADTTENTTENTADNTNTNTSGRSRVCTQCGKDYPTDARFCPYCGYSEMTGFFAEGQFKNFNPIDENTDIGEGVTAKEASEVILLNNYRYVSRFLTLNKKKKTSWNWAGFLLPGSWLAYRKMYKEAIVAVVFSIISTLLTFPITFALAQLPDSAQTNLSIPYLIENLPKIGTLPLVLAGVGLFLALAVRIVSALYGDWFYKKRVIYAAGELKKAKMGSSEDEMIGRKKWTGVSFFGFLIAFVAMEFIPSVVLMFI